MKLSEKKLLDGLVSLSINGWSAISEVGGRRIVWTYRRPADGNFRLATADREEADSITVEAPWRETLRLNKLLTMKQKKKVAQLKAWAKEWRPC